MMSAVFFALGYWTRVLREGAGGYDFRACPETPAHTPGSGSQPEAAAPRDKPTQTLSPGASLVPPGATLLQVAASQRESDALPENALGLLSDDVESGVH
jgi:hypothetical protein